MPLSAASPKDSPLPSWPSQVRLNLSAAMPAHVAAQGLAFMQQWTLQTHNEPTAGACPNCFQLSYLADAWQLFPPEQSEGLGKHPLIIDFVHNPRFAQAMVLREPLAKAAGLRANLRPMVIDLTAGLGRDAWAMASTGCRVVAFERHPLVHFLLNDGLHRARAHPATRTIAENIVLHWGDARLHAEALLTQINREALPIWLIDPMFPEREKSALVKKDMRMFHHLVGADTDASALFDWSRGQPGARWIVKRSPRAPSLNPEAPAMVISSERVRFDCYLPRPKTVEHVKRQDVK